MQPTSFLWTHEYADYTASLYQSSDQVLARLTSGSKTFEIARVVFGVLDELSPSRLLDCCAQKALKNNVAIFPYPSLEKAQEVWVFEVTPAAAHHLWKAKNIHRKESSAANCQKVLTYLKTALKVQGNNQELEKAILDTKKKLFLLQAESYASNYLSAAEKVLFLKTKEGIPVLEQLLGWIYAWKDEKQPHIYLMRAVVYEFLLDQPLLAADSYVSLAQVSEDTKALECMNKACSFFKTTGPVLNYAHFLEKIDRKFLAKFAKYPKFDSLLLQKDAIRMTFERALVLFNKLPSNPTCFICCSPQEEDVVLWIHHALAFDLRKIGVSPIYATQDLCSTNDYKSFQEKISSADKVVIICTPELKQKCTTDHPMGIAHEIRLVRERYDKSTLAGGISLLYLLGNRQTSCPDPFLEPIFAGQYATEDQPIEKTVFNYYEMAFELFAPMKGLSNLEALEIKECFVDAIKVILNGEISQNDVDDWRKCRWKKRELGSLQDLQEIYNRLECTQPHLLVQKDLREHYASKKHIALLVSQKEIPIEQLYTRLAIIGEAEKKQTKKETEETTPGHSLELGDRRPLTHESIFEPKKAILLEELFKHDQLKGDPKRILIQGSAGIGKSTLCHHIAYRWAQKTLFTAFEYLLWLPLRRLDIHNVRLMQNPTWNDYIAQECGLESAQVRILFSQKENQKKTLVLLDGYDELSGDATNNQGCFYPALQALKAFPNVIITSRPREIRGFTNKESVLLEILGFDSKGIEEYVDHFFSKDQQVQAKNLRTQLQQPLVKSLAHIPINLEIFCSLAAADEPLFSSSESPTLTGVYIKLTDWLFKRFRIERNKKDPDIVRKEINAASAFDVRHLTQVLEQIAWEAMDRNTLYPSLTTITEIYQSVEHVQKVEIGIESIQNVGPLRIEDNQGVFIHLTFQEYFAAAYLARLYNNNPPEAGKLLAKIKFEPRYRLVLWMTAGSLSQKGKLNDLQAFFKDLYSKPRDLAESYELTLFAQCFEECLTEHLEQIIQYKEFITSAVSYMKKAPFKSMKFQLLNRNTKLVCKPEIIDVMIKLMHQPDSQFETIALLGKLARGKLPPEALLSLLEIADEKSLDKSVRARAAEALGQIAASGQALPTEALSTLLKIARDASFECHVQVKAIGVLDTIAASGQALPTEALSTLLKIARDASFERYVQVEAIRVLGRIAVSGQLPTEAHLPLLEIVVSLGEDAFKALTQSALSGQTLPPNALSPEAPPSLMKIVVDTSFPRYIRVSAVEVLGKIAALGQPSAPEALSTLLKIARDASLDGTVQESAIEVLGKIAALGQALPTETLLALLTIASNASLERDVQVAAIRALGKIAASGQALSTEAVSALLKIAGDASFDGTIQARSTEAGTVQARAIEALGEIAASGQTFPTEALLSLMKIVDGPSNKHLLISALRTLGKIAASGQTLPQKAVSVLVEIAGDTALGTCTRKSAIGALLDIAASGQTLPPEALLSLMKIVGDLSNKHLLLSAVQVLGLIAKSGQTLPTEALFSLVKLADNPFLKYGVRICAIRALGMIAASGQTLLPEALFPLVKIVGDPFLDRDDPFLDWYYLRVFTIRALGMIAASGQALPTEALLSLVKIAGDASPSLLRHAMEVLGTIAASGQASAPEALLFLVKMAGDAARNEVGENAIEALEKIELSQLMQHLDSAKEVCYRTHRAWVESEHQVRISDNNLVISFQKIKY